MWRCIYSDLTKAFDYINNSQNNPSVINKVKYFLDILLLQWSNK